MSEGSVKIELGNGVKIESSGTHFNEVCVETKQDFVQETMTPGTFGWAIERMKNGDRLTRRGWNGKRQYIELASCISYRNPRGQIVNANHDAIGSNAIAFVGMSGTQIGWLASQSDMLAEDWEIFV